jgi:glycosyltransferase involved in cell wall biosynthesis
MKLGRLTMIVPFYRNSAMLAEQIREWNRYPEGFKFIVIDDGSPEPALPIIEYEASLELLERLSIYRIGVDIPWNRGGARNLGAQLADTDWIIHVDIDHLLPVESAKALLEAEVTPLCWYRFPRFRKGRADETRRKDALPDDVTFGQIKPHVDSYLCTKAMFWQAGGYNEEFSGCLGGGTPFLSELAKIAEPELLPETAALHVYTRDVIADASDHTLSRDTSEFTRRKKAMGGNYRGSNPIRFPWTQEL